MKKGGIKILAVDRQKKILKWVENDGSITINKVSQRLGISKVTARKDIDILESKGFIIRKHGGAIKKEIGTAIEPFYTEKKRKNHSCKISIGRAAAEFVNDGDTIILDSGSTSYEMTPFLSEKQDLTVITYDLMIAIALSTDTDINVIITGGTVRRNLFTTRGNSTTTAFSKLHANKTFLTADAIDIEQGISSATVEGSFIKQEIIKSSDEIFLIADHSKFDKISLAQVAHLKDINQVITDNTISTSIMQEIEKMGIPIKLVNEDSHNYKNEEEGV